MKKVVIYSTPTCHFCHIAKDFFTKNNIAFEDFNVAIDEFKRNEMIEKSGQMGVPVIDIEGDVIIGFDEARIKQHLGL